MRPSLILPAGCLFAAILLAIGGCASKTVAPTTTPPPPGAVQPGKPKPYKVMGEWYTPVADARGFHQKGRASWYGEQFHGRRTSNGEVYDMYGISAAHKTLPLGTFVRVINLENNRTLDVRINDRGPFVHGRIIDLSYGAAEKLGVVEPGTAPVEIVALGTPAPGGSAGRPAYQAVDFYSGNFTFQVGAFTDRENARRLLARLGLNHKNAHITPYDNGQRIFYRVRVGHCSTLDAADRYERALADEGFSDVFTVAE